MTCSPHQTAKDLVCASVKAHRKASKLSGSQAAASDMLLLLLLLLPPCSAGGAYADRMASNVWRASCLDKGRFGGLGCLVSLLPGRGQGLGG